MDKVDSYILKTLMNNGRIAWKELAHDLKVSAPTVADRIRKLELQGLIKGYAALLNPELVGCELAAFVFVTLARPEDREPFLKTINKHDEVQECHHIAGDDDYLLKVRCQNTKALDRFISDELKSLKGIVRTRTTIVLDSVKECSVLPLKRILS